MRTRKAGSSLAHWSFVSETKFMLTWYENLGFCIHVKILMCMTLKKVHLFY